MRVAARPRGPPPSRSPVRRSRQVLHHPVVEVAGDAQALGVRRPDGRLEQPLTLPSGVRHAAGEKEDEGGRHRDQDPEGAEADREEAVEHFLLLAWNWSAER